MNNTDLKTLKERCLNELRAYLPTIHDQLNSIDARCYTYIADAVRTDMDTANIYELLGIRKQLRLMVTYPWNLPRFHQWLHAIEGRWQNGQHLSGGLKFDTPRGPRHVPLMPYQVWCLCGMYLLDHDVKLREYNAGDHLEETEFILTENEA